MCFFIKSKWEITRFQRKNIILKYKIGVSLTGKKVNNFFSIYLEQKVRAHVNHNELSFKKNRIHCLKYSVNVLVILT